MSMPRQVAMLVVSALLAVGCQGSKSDAASPVARAGMDRLVYRGEMVTLDGRASTPGHGAISYLWRQTEGPALPLLNNLTAQVSFTAPRQTTLLRFELVVSDDRGTSAPDEVVVQVQNRAPIAVAGTDLVIALGDVVALDAGASSDPDGDRISASWYQTGGTPVALEMHPGGVATFTAPSTPTDLHFALVVSDGELTSAEDVVRVQVVDPSANWPPMAFAGSDLSVARRSVVTLSGSATDRESDPLTWTWTQLAGPAVSLLGADTPSASFVAPATETDLEFQLVVADAFSNGADRVVVRVRNQAPVISSFTLSPVAPLTNDPLVAAATVADVDQDPVTVSWSWWRNGLLLAGETGPTIAPDLTTRGDLFTVKATASDGSLQVTAEANVTIQDSPPVLTVSGPATATWGAPVTLAVTGEDPDGDPVGTLVLKYGPAGMTISPTGDLNWIPRLPMFGEQLEVHYAIGMEGFPALGVDRSLVVSAPGRQEPLRRTGIEIPVKPNGLVAADLDGDGVAELLVAGRLGLYELAYAGGGYAQRWVYPFAAGPTTVSAVTAKDLDGDGRPEIFLASVSSSPTVTGVVVELDGATRRELGRIDLPCHDLKAADLDGDGAVELVCLSRSDPYFSTTGKVIVLDAATLARKWETSVVSVGLNLAIGNVDADAALEIVTAGGYVFNGATGANKWASSTAFGAVVAVGDLDGDGVAEIVGMDEWDRFRGFSAVLKAPLWEKATFDNDALLVADVNGDGVDEIVVGDGQWGDVTVYGYRTATNDLAVLSQLNSQEHGVTAIAMGDFDGDGRPELAWGSGATSSGADFLVVAGWNPLLGVEWTGGGTAQLDGPFVGAKLARTAVGAAPGLVFEVPETASGYDGARIVRLDPSSGAVVLSPELGSNWSSNRALDVFDQDGDGVDEIFISTARLYDGYLTAWDFAAGAAEWSSPAPALDAVALTHADLTGDGVPDLVAVTWDGFVQVFDVKHATLAWKSTSIGSGVDVEVADVDGDGLTEIVALSTSRLVLFHRAASGSIPWLEVASVPVSGGDLAVGDCDGDGAPEIYVLGGGSVRRFDGALVPQNAFAVVGSAVSLFIEELGPGRKNLVLGRGEGYAFSGSTYDLEAVDAATGARIWASPGLWGTAVKNSLGYVELAADGSRQLAFGTGLGMYLTR